MLKGYENGRTRVPLPYFLFIVHHLEFKLRMHESTCKLINVRSRHSSLHRSVVVTSISFHYYDYDEHCLRRFKMQEINTYRQLQKQLFIPFQNAFLMNVENIITHGGVWRQSSFQMCFLLLCLHWHCFLALWEVCDSVHRRQL